MNALAERLESGEGDIFSRIAQAIEKRGYAVVDAALPTGLVDALFVHLSTLPVDAFTRAGIGREAGYQLNRFVRSDTIQWLDPGEPACGTFLDWMEQLRLGVNQRLFIGLFDYEAHFARYAPGSFYRKHVDAFAGCSNNRVLSTVFYLNPAWTPGNGGEMVLYGPGEDGAVIETVQPVYGRLAVFLSERFPHEVLPTQVTRFSIAGWFRVNGSVNGVLDPPR